MVVVAGKCLGKSRRETIWGGVFGVNLLGLPLGFVFHIAADNLRYTYVHHHVRRSAAGNGNVTDFAPPFTHAHICQRRGRGRFISSFEYPISLFYSLQGQ
jgi:hypothetical protein